MCGLEPGAGARPEGGAVSAPGGEADGALLGLGGEATLSFFGDDILGDDFGERGVRIIIQDLNYEPVGTYKRQ